MKELALTLPRYGKIQTPSGIPTGGLSDPTGLQGIINLTINLLFVVGVIGALIMILFAGIQWITSGGDKTKLEGAKGRLTWAIIGLILLILAFVIVEALITLLGGQPSFYLNKTP